MTGFLPIARPSFRFLLYVSFRFFSRCFSVVCTRYGQQRSIFSDFFATSLVAVRCTVTIYQTKSINATPIYIINNYAWIQYLCIYLLILYGYDLLKSAKTINGHIIIAAAVNKNIIIIISWYDYIEAVVRLG